jgi:hypothetical protein
LPTCHFAHGTTTTNSYSGGSNLLRMEERGVCENCHRKTVSATAPTATVTNKGNNLIITFSGYMQATTATAVGKYQLQTGAGAAVTNWATGVTARIQPSGTVLGKVITIENMGATLTVGQPYKVIINNVNDSNGNTITNYTTVNFTAQ